MKRIYTILALAILLAIGVGETHAQVVDVCAGNDTVELRLGNYHYGLVQWQVSDDNEIWMDIDGAIDAVYRFLPERARYYRAKVRFPNCAQNDYLSQVSYVQVPPKAKAGVDFDIPAGTVYRLRGNAIDAAVGQWEVIEGTGFELQDPSDPNSGFIGGEGTYKLTWTLSNSCGSSTDTVTLNCMKVEYNSNLVVVDETDDILSDSTMLVNGDYVIRFADPVPNIDTASILIGYRDDSFLRRVVSFEREGNVFYLKTEQGYLNDVIKSGAFCFNILPSELGDKSSSVKYLDHYPTRKELAEDPFLLRDGSIYVIRSVHDNEEGKDEDIDITILIEDGSIQLGADVNMGLLDHELEGLRYEHTISLTPSFDADIAFDGSGHLSRFYMGFYDAQFEVTRRFHIDHEMTSVGFKKSGKFNKKPKIVTGFFVGNVPVIVKLDWPYSVELSLALDGLEMTSTRTTTFTCAVEYNPVSDSFEEVLEKSEPVETVEWGDLNGTLEMEFKAGPKFTFIIAGVFGPYVKATGKIAPSLCVSTQPPFDISTRVRFGLDLTLGCKFQLFTEFFSAELSWPFHIIDHTESSPKSVLKKGGDHQVYSFGNYLPQPISVDVKGLFGMNMKLANVRFEPQNGGEVSQSIVASGLDGVASTFWKPGLPYGHDRLKVRVFDCEGNPVAGTPLTFHAYSSATDPCIESTLAVEAYHVNENSIIPLVTGGVPPYLYSLDDESYSIQQPTIVISSGHNYTFYVRDAIGCEAMTTYNVPFYDCTNSTLLLTANVVGNTIMASALGGISPYWYSIDGVNFQPMGTFAQLFDGDYTVYVRDALGCVETKQVTISRPGHIYLEISNIENNQGTAFAYPLDHETLHDKGVCWSTHHEPTVDDFTASYGPAIERFPFEITSFEPNVEYYVRAYALDASGTSYSREVVAQSQQGITEPYVIATKIEDVTLTSAIGTGSVFWDGGADVTERGICWSLNHTPTINDFHASSGEGMGHFSVEITNLTPHATYYARAYAINRIGIAYASEVDFVAQPGGNLHIPQGAINGRFTIGNEQQVYFSQGNLQYQASTNTWRFANHQYDYIGDDNNAVSPTYDGWIDIFAWGTSGYNHGAVCYQPWSHNDVPSDYYAYGDASLNLDDQNGQADWGYNPISNGGNTAHAWHTLTMEEWRCLLYSRDTPSGIHFAKGRVNNVNGVLLVPDNWSTSTYPLNNPDDNYGSFEDNVISVAQWQTLEEAGVVFLPAAGGRSYYSVASAGDYGFYWTSSYYLNDYATDIVFDDTYLGPTVAGSHNSPRFYGRTVRLVSEGVSGPSTQLPQVTTMAVTEFTSSSATCGGIVISDGGSTVMERGVCWSTDHNPTVGVGHVSAGSGSGSFTVSVTGLAESTTYYVRAYAINSTGTSYGNEVSFTTLSGGSGYIPWGFSSASVNNITAESVDFVGSVSSWGSCSPLGQGACWSTSPQPTLTDSLVGGWFDGLDGDLYGTVSGLTPNTTYHLRVFITDSVQTVYSNDIVFTTLPSGGDTHEYVDLGLPSGTLWATCNMGANAPEEYGDYFAWGETQPKDYYDWSTYQYCNGSENTLTKYCTYPNCGYNGFVDNLTALQPKDDAATINWGDEWCMPTDAQWEELYQNTTWTWTTHNGVLGHLFVANNGNAIFLPSCGYYKNDSLYSLGANGYFSSGFYWSNSLGTVPNCAFGSAHFASYEIYCGLYSRCIGFSIRPVRSSSPSGQLPQVTTMAVTEFTSSSATCGGNVVSDGGTMVTERGVCWSTNQNPTVNGDHATAGSGLGSFTVSVTGLAEGTTYYVRAYATNTVGTAYGNEVSFIALSGGSGYVPWEINRTHIQDITTESVFYVGLPVNGTSSILEKGACWSTSPQPSITDSFVGGSFDVNGYVYGSVYGLLPNTTYYLRVFVTDSVQTSYSEDIVFTTLEEGDYTPHIVISEISNITATSATVEYHITDNGGSDILNSGVCYSTHPEPTVDDYFCGGNISGLLPNTTYYVRAWAMNIMASSYSDELVFTTLSDGGGDHEYIDLGLPSGTLWATCNVGANAPEEYGDYFAWGETQPKDVYNWNTYQYCNGSNTTLTKYCNNPNYGYNGFSDTLTTLLPEDDPASVNWGSDWRTPTATQWEELFNYCGASIIAVTQNGVNGWQVTGPNGNTIFMPNAGICWGNEVYAIGEGNVFWSSSLSTPHPWAASSYQLGSFDFSMYYYGRCNGMSIRPVRSNSGPTSEVPEGAINGLFSVSEGHQVYFSQGNLQYQASTNTWKFAENQWDYVGEANNNISPTYDGWIDLFGWGTSGNNHGAVCYQPWSTDMGYTNYFAYGNSDYNLYDQTGQADWGYNPINNGVNQENLWRVLTQSEWSYVLNTRNTISGIRYAKACVNGVNGLILVSDQWDGDNYTLVNPDIMGAPFDSNIIALTTWESQFENSGCVFLPAAGLRMGVSTSNANENGIYWSATCNSIYYADYIDIYGVEPYPMVHSNRYYGLAVRLVYGAGSGSGNGGGGGH